MLRSPWFLLCYLVPVCSFAQIAADIDWGPSYKEPRNSNFDKIITHTADGFYALRTTQRDNLTMRPKVFLEKYRQSDMKLLRERELDLRHRGKVRELEDIILFGGKLHLLTSFNNLGQRTNYLFREELSYRSLQPTGDLVKIAEAETRLGGYQAGQFGYHVSSDSSHLLVYNVLPLRDGEPERFDLRVFDRNFNERWHRPIALPYRADEFEVEDYRIDRNGNVYLLGVVYEAGQRLERRNAPTYRYVILAYRNGGETVDRYDIDLDGLFISELTFRVNRNGELVCAGFYSARNSRDLRGSYYLRIDPTTKQVLAQGIKDFGFELISQYMRPGEARRAAKREAEGDARRAPELYRYKLDELILRSDGGALLVAEQFFVRRIDVGTGAFYAPGAIYGRTNRQVQYVYNYNDLLVVNIRPDGEIEWTTRIPKVQETKNDGGHYSSYVMANVRDKLYFVFNDDRDNFRGEEQRYLQEFNGGRNSVIALVEVRRDGTWDSYPLGLNSDAQILTRPKVGKQIGRRTVALLGERWRNYRFGKLVLPE